MFMSSIDECPESVFILGSPLLQQAPTIAPTIVIAHKTSTQFGSVGPQSSDLGDPTDQMDAYLFVLIRLQHLWNDCNFFDKWMQQKNIMCIFLGFFTVA